MEMAAISSSRLDESAAVFRQFAAEQFHDVRPRRDGITRAETHAGGNQTVAQRLVAVHHHLMAVLFVGRVKLERLEQVVQRVIVAGVETASARCCTNARILAAETFLDELGQFGNVQVENLREQAEGKNIFALVLGRCRRWPRP